MIEPEHMRLRRNILAYVPITIAFAIIVLIIFLGGH